MVLCVSKNWILLLLLSSIFWETVIQKQDLWDSYMYMYSLPTPLSHTRTHTHTHIHTNTHAVSQTYIISCEICKFLVIFILQFFKHLIKAWCCCCVFFILLYSQLCLSWSRISRISPKSKVYTRHLSFILYCFLPHIIRILSKSNLFLQSQEIRLR